MGAGAGAGAGFGAGMNTGDVGMAVGIRIAEGAGAGLGATASGATRAALGLRKLGGMGSITAPPMWTAAPLVASDARWWAV